MTVTKLDSFLITNTLNCHPIFNCQAEHSEASRSLFTKNWILHCIQNDGVELIFHCRSNVLVAKDNVAYITNVNRHGNVPPTCVIAGAACSREPLRNVFTAAFGATSLSYNGESWKCYVEWIIWVHSAITTVVPTSTKSNNAIISALRMRTQPCEPVFPSSMLSGVP